MCPVELRDSRPRRGRRQGQRDLIEPRRNPPRLAGGRAGLAAGLGFRRGRRGRRRRRQRPQARHAGRRHPAVRGLGRAGQLPHPRGGGLAGRRQRRPGIDAAGRRPHGAARAAPGRAAPWPQGAGRRCHGRGRPPCLSARFGGRRAGVGPCAPAGIARGGRRMVRRARRARPRSRGRQALWAVLADPRFAWRRRPRRRARDAAAGRHLRRLRRIGRQHGEHSRAASSSAPAARSFTGSPCSTS